MRHLELHRTDRIGWLRASVLGANDGLISTSALVMGIAAAEATRGPILLAAMAGLVAGALSMAAGEYVSVSSQSDTEEADLSREREELATEPERELVELTSIYTHRGLTPELAKQVAVQLTANDALKAHARDELGIVDLTRARPLQAALSSAVAFALGAVLPVLITWLTPLQHLKTVVVMSTVVLLAGLGAFAAQLGGANRMRGAARVALWGAIAMLCSGLVGKLFGTVVA